MRTVWLQNMASQLRFILESFFFLNGYDTSVYGTVQVDLLSVVRVRREQ